MATAALAVTRWISPLAWFRDFLREELAPYPGRDSLVIRMVIAATLVMIIGMTFRIPYIFQGAFYALVVSRESPRATLGSAATIFLVTAIGAACLLATVWFVVNFPLFHILWIVTFLFLAFYTISALTNYSAAVGCAIMVAIVAPLWDRHVSAETNVEDTLWVCLAVLVGVVITAGVELVFARLRSVDEIVLLITNRLAAVENLVTCYADGRGVDPATERNINRLETLGTSMLRTSLRRSDYSPQYSVEMGGVAGLTGRLVDLAAAMMQVSFEPSADDRSRFRNLASSLARIRTDLKKRGIPGPVQFDTDKESLGIPFLGEMERAVTQIPQVFAGSRYMRDYLPSADDIPRPALFVPDALVNPEHLHLALKGCLAASVCYLTYNAIAWPGISTAVTTCLLTGLSTVGASRQKQLLRITGAIAGGFILGMGSQIFILPYLDSIAGFVVLFVAVTALSAWFITSSPRLSYFGIQAALAYYLINLNEFKFQTSLAAARDRVVGILLGLFVMWVVFDQMWGAPSAVEMKRTFISNLRLVAQFAREPLSNDPRTALAQNLALRETISTNLDKVRGLGDAVLLEFGPSRGQQLALRSRIRQWQTELRVLFITGVVLWRYGVPLPGFELPKSVSLAQRGFEDEVAKTLDAMADRFEDRPGAPRKSCLQDSFKRLEDTVHACDRRASQRAQSGRTETFLALSRRMEQTASLLDREI
jgi:multidrug resistance protein MdtO